MISGGPSDGDSNWARKASGRRLENLGINTGKREGPNDYALVIRATIANYHVSQIFVDTESSVNVLFKDTFEQMQIDLAELKPMNTSIFRFEGHEVQPLGQISLPISIGEEPTRRTRTTTFTVVDTSSSYNVILGRLALSSSKPSFPHIIKRWNSQWDIRSARYQETK